MIKSNWIDGIVGIIRKASVEDSSKVFDVIDPKAVGADTENVRAITISVVRDDLQKGSSADLVIFWKGTNNNIYEKHFDDEKEALSAFAEMCSSLEEIDKQIKDGENGKAKESSKALLDYLDVANKKKVWDKSLKLDEEKKEDDVKIENKGTLTDNKLEFSNEYLVELISPIDVVNTLPASFLTNLPSRVYNTHSFNHISKQNFSAWLYKDFIINDKKIASVAVIEKSTMGKPLYFITANCNDEKFDTICSTLTPTLESIKSIKKADYYSGDVKPTEEKVVEQKPEENEKLKGDEVGKNPDTKVGSINVEAKKLDKEVDPVYTPQQNGEAGYRISDWDGQHPADFVSFETPLIAKFDKRYGLYEIEFLNGCRTRLQGDTFKVYLYNAGFRVEHVEEILKDVQKAEVVLYGNNHELAKKFAQDVTGLLKQAVFVSEAVSMLEKESELDKEAIKDIEKVLISMVHARPVSDSAVKLALASFENKNKEAGIMEVDESQLYTIACKTDPSMTPERFHSIIEKTAHCETSTLTKDNHAEDLFKDGLESKEIVDIRKRKLDEAKKSKNLDFLEAGLDAQSIELISILKDNPNKLETFSSLVNQLEDEGSIDEPMADKYRSLVATLKELEEV